MNTQETKPLILSVEERNILLFTLKEWAEGDDDWKPWQDDKSPWFDSYSHYQRLVEKLRYP